MILEASPNTPMIVLYSYFVGIALPIILLNMTCVISLLVGGYSIDSIRSAKNPNMRSLSSLSAGSGLLGTLSAWKNSYITMLAACDRFNIGYSSPVGIVISTSHWLSSSWRRPMSSLPNTTAIFSGYPLQCSANSRTGTGTRV